MRITRAIGPMLLILAFAALAPAQVKPQDKPQDCPMHEAHQHAAKSPAPGVIERGNAAMGFDQDKTTHHFLLRGDGGVIQVTVNDAADADNLKMIRSHLAHIADSFAKGDFNIPMLVHDQVPNGVPVMKQLRDKITYRYEQMDKGGRVVIQTNDPQALAAIHEFLKFQIREHATGDSLKVE